MAPNPRRDTGDDSTLNRIHDYDGVSYMVVMGWNETRVAMVPDRTV